MITIESANVVSFALARIARLEKLLASRELNLPSVESRRAWSRTAVELLDLLDEVEPLDARHLE